jgi:hypothetical protein
LIGSKFEISRGSDHISRSALLGVKADTIVDLSFRMILITSQFVLSER